MVLDSELNWSCMEPDLEPKPAELESEQESAEDLRDAAAHELS